MRVNLLKVLFERFPGLTQYFYWAFNKERIATPLFSLSRDIHINRYFLSLLPNLIVDLDGGYLYRFNWTWKIND